MMAKYMTQPARLIKCSHVGCMGCALKTFNEPIVRKALDLILPPTCAGCGQVVADADVLCADCWSRLTFLGRPCCESCGHPFDYDVPDLTLCGPCARERPPFQRARAALRYDDGSKDFILRFKHADKLETRGLLVKWLAMAGGDLLGDADVLVPVPLHWTRLVARRYNQAAVLASEVGRLSGVAVALDALARTKRTPSQGHLGLKARARNVRGAFVVPPRRFRVVRGRRVVLIDDVYTTGATVKAAARALVRAGARGVDVLTLARVVKETT